MGVAFFTNWPLWEEMTFVLGCAILIVFLIGLVKLWWTNRQDRHQELLDEEKKARLGEMRRVGLSPNKKRGNVPFGIRAIQSGVEVQGIWISQPTTPSGTSSHSKLVPTVTGAAASVREMTDKGKKPMVQQATITADQGSSTHPPLLLGPAAARPVVQHLTTAPRGGAVLYRGVMNEEAMRRVHSHHSPTTTSRPPQPTAYVPSTGATDPGSQNQYRRLQPHPNTSGHYRPTQQAAQSSTESVSASGGTSSHNSESSSSIGPPGLLGRAAIYGPAESHAHRAMRSVNPTFAVLPAGAFGREAQPTRHKLSKMGPASG